MIVTNNHRVLHGRATQPVDGTERCMVWGYAYKHTTELRYRLLKQRQLERAGVDEAWTTRLPNQLVGDLVRRRRQVQKSVGHVSRGRLDSPVRAKSVGADHEGAV